MTEAEQEKDTGIDQRTDEENLFGVLAAVELTKASSYKTGLPTDVANMLAVARTRQFRYGDRVGR